MNQICKKFVFAGAFLTVGLSSVAYADSIFIKTELDVVGNKISEVKEVHFTPTTNVLVVDVAGKKCSFGSSTQGSVPKGCNYTITIDGAGVIPSAREADDTCMKTPMVCK
ncbi:hypothetical protein [Candidatus Electronema sp. JC]|uniref:hypothetical protein n=1 Tax=Candidatus Electronema sp. JC TaxID=3401570 RepID=UPI003AA91A46